MPERARTRPPTCTCACTQARKVVVEVGGCPRVVPTATKAVVVSAAAISFTQPSGASAKSGESARPQAPRQRALAPQWRASARQRGPSLPPSRWRSTCSAPSAPEGEHAAEMMIDGKRASDRVRGREHREAESVRSRRSRQSVVHAAAYRA